MTYKYIITQSLALLMSLASNAFEVKSGQMVVVSADTARMEPVAKTALKMLKGDIRKVLGSEMKLVNTSVNSSIILQRDAAAFAYKKEAFLLKSANGCLYIKGSDDHGLAYGILEVSRLLGVSPWEWWADAEPKQLKAFSLKEGYHNEQAPSVEYRGIFINDEDWGLMPWSGKTYEPSDIPGHIGPKTNARIFELLLRLRANTYWPAMHECTRPFFLTEGNREVAQQYGIYIGGSHCEPMASSTAGEWKMRGIGKYDFLNNRENVLQFWEDRVKEVAGQPILYTIGMRGVHDGAMQGAKTTEEQKTVLDSVLVAQRELLGKYVNKDVTQVPQLFVPYKEVLDVYHAGLQVPDDVCLVWCDDNYGMVRHFPTAAERARKGGNGIYYHVSYWGRPHDYLWLGTFSPALLYQQMSEAWHKGIQKFWILNVGDLKPMEYPISQFMDMAWNPHKYSVNNITRHTRDWCAQQFGESQADEAARILNLICKYNGRCTPEMLDKSTYSLENGEWQEVVNQYLQLEADALRQYNSLPAAYHDAYRQIILFPIELMSNLHQMYFAQAQNHALYKQNNPKANIWADECERLFKRDSLICDEYNHKMSGGKWNGMMTQKHIGYKSWNDAFEKDTCPELFRVTSKDGVIISENNGVVEIEAPYYSSKTDAAEAKWTEIPFMGKSVSAMTLMPYTKSVKGASITYKFKMQVSKTSDGKAFNGNVSNGKKKVRIHVITKSTLDYLNKGGLTYGVSLDGASPVEVNFNKDLNEKPENIYNIYYPTIATRIVDKVIELELPASSDGIHTLTLTPNDPAIVFEKIVIDGRGGKKSIKVI